jgi:hypothetical protein
MRVVWTDAALADVDDILAFTAANYPMLVNSVERRIRAVVERLGTWPASAEPRCSGRREERQGTNPPLEGGSKPRSGFGEGAGSALHPPPEIASRFRPPLEWEVVAVPLASPCPPKEKLSPLPEPCRIMLASSLTEGRSLEASSERSGERRLPVPVNVAGIVGRLRTRQPAL